MWTLAFCGLDTENIMSHPELHKMEQLQLEMDEKKAQMQTLKAELNVLQPSAASKKKAIWQFLPNIGGGGQENERP